MMTLRRAGNAAGRNDVGVAGVDLGGHLAQHIQVIDGAGSVHQDQRGGVGVVDQVFHVAGAETRVDGNQDGSDFGDGAEQEQPLGAVGHPDGYLVAGLDTEVDQRAGDAVDLIPELIKRPALALVHQRLAGAETVGGLVQQVAKGLLVKPVGHGCGPPV